MHTQTVARRWHHANDNEQDAPIEPPSPTPMAAQTILTAGTGNHAAMHRDAAPAHTYEFTETGAYSGALKIMIDLSTWLFTCEADPLNCIPANDL